MMIPSKLLSPTYLIEKQQEIWILVRFYFEAKTVFRAGPRSPGPLRSSSKTGRYDGRYRRGSEKS